jgi:putative addiction module component (TIGR02574 family)
MAVTPDELRDLPPAEKLCLVDFLWDELGNSDVSIPLPDWVDREAARRRNEMVEDPTASVEHDEVWRRIKQRS